MKTKYVVGDSAFNDNLSLLEGMVSIDQERKAIRFYDGVTVGGYEIPCQRAVPPNLGPGSQELLAGDMAYGFFGEVTSDELITYNNLSTAIGLSAGSSYYNLESLWLKFALDGKILYVAKKPVRYNLSWNHISAANAVFGTASVNITESKFKVRLLKGVVTDPTTSVSGYDPSETHGSEWNRLFYPVHSGVHLGGGNPTPHTDPTALPFGSWAQYSDEDLVISGALGYGYNGVWGWCQETIDGTTSRIIRGKNGVTHVDTSINNGTGTVFGFRPVLELVP